MGLWVCGVDIAMTITAMRDRAARGRVRLEFAAVHRSFEEDSEIRSVLRALCSVQFGIRQAMAEIQQPFVSAAFARVELGWRQRVTSSPSHITPRNR